LAAALRHSDVSKQLADTAGFLNLHEVFMVANLRIDDIRTCVKFSHRDGTPRFQSVLVPTDAGVQHYVRATRSQSFEVADDIIATLQIAARDARRAWNNPSMVETMGETDACAVPTVVEPRPPADPSVSSASPSAPPAEGVFAAAEAEPETAPSLMAPKIEGVLPVSLVDDAVP
jgi:hypothetical protein